MSEPLYPRIPLSDVLSTIESGSRPSGGVREDSDGVPSLGGENVTRDGCLVFDGIKRIPVSFYQGMPRGHLREGDVVINKDGAQTGKVALYDGGFEKVAINEHLFLLRGRTERLDGRYLYWSLLSGRVQAQIARAITGSAQPGINHSFARQVSIPLPPVQVQRRIAEILDTLDEAIRKTEEIIVKLEQAKQGLLRDLLTRGIDENGGIRDPEQHPEQFRETGLGRIPKVWQLVEVGELSEFVTSGSRGWASYYSETGPLFLRIGNLTREHINLRLEDLVHVRPPAAGEGTRTQVQAGDLLISITADLGIVGIVPPSLGEAYVNQHIALVRLRPDQVNPRWVGHYLSGHQCQRRFRHLDDPGAKAGLNLPTIRSLTFTLPPESEQAAIVSLLDAQDATLRAESMAREKLDALKQGLMDDLLTGHVRVSEAEEALA